MTPRTVGVVVVNWNGEEFLEPCLTSVLAQEGVTPRPLVLDNGSTDGSLALLREKFPAVPVIERENNYAAANNQGVAESEGDCALLLNTDATLAPGCLATLVGALDTDDDVAGVAPRILGPDGNVQTLGIEESDLFYWRDLGMGGPDPGPGAPREAFGLSGCCVLYRKAAWEAVGGQDEDFHMYYEDVEFGLRLRAAGFRLLLVPDAVCVHEGHGSIRKARTGKDVRGERNRLLVLVRHFPERFAAELARSPWFAQATDPEERTALLALLVERLGGGIEGRDRLLAAFAEGLATLVARAVVAGGGRTLLEERDLWIETLLHEVRRLRLYRLPGRRLKRVEREFLDRRRG